MVGSVKQSERSCAFKQVLGQSSTAHPAKIVNAFNTWAFKRQQPSDLDQLTAVAAIASQRSRPLPFVLYWGKGPRDFVHEPELHCLDFLASMAQRVADVHAPGAHFELLQTDTHAELNGHTTRDIRAYFSDVTQAAVERGFTTRLLSDVMAKSGVPAGLPEAVMPSDDALRVLEACAEKWYRGEGQAADGAAAYFAMNMREKRAVQDNYPEAIFITFNSSSLRILFPDGMPIFYMYSLRKGCAIKPWFVSEEANVQIRASGQMSVAPALAAG